MFVILRPVEVTGNYFEKRKKSKFIARSPVSMHRESGALPFFSLDVAAQKTDWKTVAEKCGRYASRIVAPVSFPLPDGTPLRRFVPSSTVNNFVLNTAVSCLHSARLDPHSFTLTLTDRLACLAAETVDLIELCSCVRIITSRPEKYADACENALNDFGASLILRPCYEPTQKPDIIICADGAVCTAMSNAAVFAARKSDCAKLLFYFSGFELLPQHKELLPEGARPLDLAGALTELCTSTAYSSACFTNIAVSCRKCRSPSPENCIKCYVGQSRTKHLGSVQV